MTIESVAGRRRYRVSPTDIHMVQIQERPGARWLDYMRTLSLREANALVLTLAREDETQELPAVTKE